MQIIPIPTRSTFDNLTGRTFHDLTVIGYAGTDGTHQYWWCSCACGDVSRPSANALKRDRAKSCGCRRATQCGDNFRTHGLRHTSAYNIWASMLDRCRNPHNVAYKNYGQRGITVCNRWRESFENFLTDMGDRPDGTSLERKNNNLGYSPENCEWADKIKQANNRRSVHNITFKGKTQSLTAWARDVGLNRCTLRHRLVNRKWSIEMALTSPLKINQHC